MRDEDDEDDEYEDDGGEEDDDDEDGGDLDPFGPTDDQLVRALRAAARASGRRGSFSEDLLRGDVLDGLVDRLLAEEVPDQDLSGDRALRYRLTEEGRVAAALGSL